MWFRGNEMGVELPFIVYNVDRDMLGDHHIECMGYMTYTSYWEAVGDRNMWR